MYADSQYVTSHHPFSIFQKQASKQTNERTNEQEKSWTQSRIAHRPFSSYHNTIDGSNFYFWFDESMLNTKKIKQLGCGWAFLKQNTAFPFFFNNLFLSCIIYIHIYKVHMVYFEYSANIDLTWPNLTWPACQLASDGKQQEEEEEEEEGRKELLSETRCDLLYPNQTDKPSPPFSFFFGVPFIQKREREREREVYVESGKWKVKSKSQTVITIKKTQKKNLSFAARGQQPSSPHPLQHQSHLLLILLESSFNPKNPSF